jgi:hypothetical protein
MLGIPGYEYSFFWPVYFFNIYNKRLMIYGLKHTTVNFVSKGFFDLPVLPETKQFHFIAVPCDQVLFGPGF